MVRPGLGVGYHWVPEPEHWMWPLGASCYQGPSLQSWPRRPHCWPGLCWIWPKVLPGPLAQFRLTWEARHQLDELWHSCCCYCCGTRAYCSRRARQRSPPGAGQRAALEPPGTLLLPQARDLWAGLKRADPLSQEVRKAPFHVVAQRSISPPPLQSGWFPVAWETGPHQLRQLTLHSLYPALVAYW